MSAPGAPPPLPARRPRSRRAAPGDGARPPVAVRGLPVAVRGLPVAVTGGGRARGDGVPEVGRGGEKGAAAGAGRAG
jgi:hypothetical protein